MYKILPILIAACALSGCKTSNKAAPAANTNDPVENELIALAGSGAANCGRLKSQATSDLETAGKCALESAQQKRPFYVAYDMPGMTVAVAGNSEGKLFTVQSQTGGAGLVSGSCPAELRIAPSGRVTCYAPGTFPMGAGAGSHSNMTMPPAMGASPHPGAGGPSAEQPNPHKAQDQKSAPKQ